jgi:hypothetical protein
VVDAIMRCLLLYGSNVSATIYSPNIDAQTIITQGLGPVPSITVITGSGNSGNNQQVVQTNTTAQIIAVASNTSVNLYMTTDGWIDHRGRDA